MASNEGNQGSRRSQGDQDTGGDSSGGRGFAGMGEEEQRRIAQMGGEASARQQERRADGQFAGNRGGSSDSDRGGSSRGGSGSNQRGSRSKGGGKGEGGGTKSQGGGRSQGGSER